jgi:hypothetical protein
MCFQSEMSGIEELNLGARYIFPETLPLQREGRKDRFCPRSQAKAVWQEEMQPQATIALYANPAKPLFAGSYAKLLITWLT